MHGGHGLCRCGHWIPSASARTAPMPRTGYIVYSLVGNLQQATATSPQELVLDNNRHGVDWHLPLQRCASLYKYNRDHAYYECKLLHLEWNRLNDTLRCAACFLPIHAPHAHYVPAPSIYFDARGESDLRHPMQSSLIITTPVRDGQPLSSKHVLFSLQATSAQLLTSTEAHYKVKPRKHHLMYTGTPHAHHAHRGASRLMAALRLVTAWPTKHAPSTSRPYSSRGWSSGLCMPTSSLSLHCRYTIICAVAPPLYWTCCMHICTGSTTAHPFCVGKPISRP